MSNFAKARAVLAARVVVSSAALAWIAAWPLAAAAQDHGEDDHPFVVETGAAGERSVRGGVSNFGATLAVEATPIEEWLELEFGVTALATSGHTELSSDLVFKKPFRLSATCEFMIGFGPTVARALSGLERGTSHGIEAVLDVMFWRSKDRGWYMEPSWTRNAGSGERTIGLNGGLLFAWPGETAK